MKSIFLALFGMTLMTGSYISAQQYQSDHYYNPNGSWSRYYDNRSNNGTSPYGTDWDYQESWRNDKKAYFSGETQPQAWRNAHPYGPGGIGYDAAPGYQQAHPQQYQQGYIQQQYYYNQ